MNRTLIKYLYSYFPDFNSSDLSYFSQELFKSEIKEDREKMVQPEDCAEAVAFLAKLPPRVCINEITISPTWNRLYVAGLTDQIPRK